MTLLDDVEIIDDDLGDEDLAGDFFNGPVLTAAPWRNNAHMIEDLAGHALYLDPAAVTIDWTHNTGKWWTRWRPHTLITNDLDRVRFPDVDTHHDIRDLPLPDGTPESGPDVQCIDLPYVSTGGRKTSTVQEFNENYGLVDVPYTPAGTTELLCAGLSEAARVARVRNVGARAKRQGTWHAGGLVLFKCKNYVSSATLQPTVHDVMVHAAGIPGLQLVDWLLHLTRPMAQPKKRGKNKDIESAQGHGRSNCSHLLVYRRTA